MSFSSCRTMCVALSCLLAALRVHAETFTFVQLCDPQLGMTEYREDLNAFEQAVKQVNLLAPDFVLICGDLVHKPNPTSVGHFTAIRDAFTVPCHCAPGNHDMILKKQWDTLETYRHIIGKDYYAFEHKGCAFIVVNTQFWKTPHPRETAKQDAWLEQELAAATAKGQRPFIVGHHPPFFDDPDEGALYQSLPPVKRKELLTLFHGSGVEAMLTGHTHRLRVHDWAGTQYVSGESVCNNVDGRPLGFRLWTVTEGKPPEHRFVPLYRRAQIKPKPAYDPGREQGSAAACMQQLRQLDAAKDRYGMQQALKSGSAVTREALSQVFSATSELVCPGGGSYTLGNLGEDPRCSDGQHQLPYFYQFEEFQRRAADAGTTVRAVP